ncbi:relaxase/mobilization nuclease domain-containing protein [Pedobacter sp. P351]|uniref:relaxase/mobilization nuclease domain-containing protein n=1 Tax=Pedobacter superstes TaxID=3133441 RepID=UPI0030AEAE4C
MVCKITSGKELFGLLKYNETKVNKGEAEIIGGSKILGSHAGWDKISMTEKMNSFAYNLEANQRTEKVTFHVSLNPDTSDKLSKEQFEEIARTYMERMGYAEQPYLIYKHHDIEREHVHIVSIRVDDNGKKINSDFEKLRSEEVRKALELEYQLTPAESKSKKEKLEQVPVFSNQLPKYGKSDTKAAIAGITKTIINDYKYGSFNELRTLLELNGIEMRKIEGTRLDGSEINGIQYQFIDQDHRLLGHPISASKLGKDRGVKAIETRIERNISLLNNREVKTRLTGIIDNYFKSNTQPSIEGLKIELAKHKGIAVLRINENGKLYGASFIDNENKAVYNGSKLGKEYSANRLEERLQGVPYPELNTYERKLVTAIQKGSLPDLKKVPIEAIRAKMVLPLLQDPQKLSLLQGLNTMYLNKVIGGDLSVKQPTFNQILSRLIENGIFVKPMASNVNSFQAGYYKLPFNGMVPVGEGLSKILAANNYTEKEFIDTLNIAFRKNKSGELKISPKFDLIVRLNQAKVEVNNAGSIQNTLLYIDKINNSLYLDILKNSNLSGKNTNEKFTAKEIQKIIKTIAVYPSDSLRHPASKDYKDYSTEMGPSSGIKAMQGLRPEDSVTGAFNLFGSLLESLMDGVHGKNEEHKDEPTKRRRKKRRW